MADVLFLPTPVDFTAIDTTRSTVVLADSLNYDFHAAGNVDVQMSGSNLSFDGAGNVIGGTITGITLDLDGTGGRISFLQLTIAATADLGGIDNSALNLFGIALQGDDEFALFQLTRHVGAPVGLSRIFGDDLRNVLTPTPGGTNTNSGGDDDFSGGDNQFEVAGDVWRLDSASTGLGGYSYTGGSDRYYSFESPFFHKVSGDAWILDQTGSRTMTLHAGDDLVNLRGNTDDNSIVTGDVFEMNNGTLNGGDDTLLSDTSTLPDVAGDVWIWNGGTLHGGDDVILGFADSRLAGDVTTLNAPVPSGVFTLTGGHDDITGGEGSDTLAGDVMTRVSSEDNVIVGGDDVIFGGLGHDSLYGEVAAGDAMASVFGGNDVLFGGRGNDLVRGQTGDDLVDGGRGDDTLDGGFGDDTLGYATAAAGVVVNLAITAAQVTGGAGVDVVSGFENLEGSRYGDTLRGNDNGNEIHGGRGDDLLVSGLGADNLVAGNGDDTLDTVDQTGDAASGGNGDDTFLASGGGNVLVGGAGIDTVSFAGVTGSSVIDLARGQALQRALDGFDLLFQIENATGGSGNDRLVGNALRNVLLGSGGKDNMAGGDGDDTLDGGEQSDTLAGEAGNDVLAGGGGSDRLFGGTGGDRLTGGVGNDTLAGADEADSLDGGDGSDSLSGGEGVDTLLGGTGADTLSGGTGIDVLRGGDASDVLDGGEGNDFLFGDAGADTVTGGAGADRLVFAPTSGAVTDVVIGFEDTGAISDDVLDVSAYGFATVASITATARGNDVVLLLGGDDRVRLQGYLLTHTLAEIGADDFLI
jgi:hypothetical protein